MATIDRPEMPILRETPEQIYQRIANRMAVLAQKRGEMPPATGEGEIHYDLAYPIAEELSEQQQLLEYGFLQAFLPWADGEYLDASGVFFGLPRNEGESDDAYRKRLLDRARSEEGDGRRQDYERWARNVDGVGGAVAVEKARHDLSIDLYITDASGQPATEELANTVRTKLEDKRRALHELRVLPAKVYPVSIAVKLALRPDAEQAKIEEQIAAQVKTYLKGRSQIVYQQIGALFFVDGVVDFADYTLNGQEANLTVPADSVASLALAVTT
ncbi:baseplate J/gp47 family protein [Brevibacillus sp. HD1.4A]|uniref:baseplate J/gp47 family protein n=1 Tax=Brevibacillus sp. HD1.4A TaxID=2738978 RepID=UPI00156A7D74|nr:baseplate J/gp47 family protein [Brevibacillus sp. HD1.4A]NRQ55904.1 baseplate J/gp47 family protein [Brevibacillus sp. HD1.4A]